MLLSSQTVLAPNPGSETRRSSRISLAIRIVIAGIHPDTGALFQVFGETLVVNKHGALIRTVPGLKAGMQLCVTVVSNGKSAAARVVWDSPQSEGRYGIELEVPENPWGAFFPPAN